MAGPSQFAVSLVDSADHAASVASGAASSRRVPENATVRKIVRGAIDALGRHGSDSLSMSDVAQSAKVSRATLYRYFPTKAAVLEAVSEHVAAAFVHGAEDIARTVSDPMKRLKSIMLLQQSLATEEFIERITEVEPGLVLRFLADHYPRYLQAMRVVLDPLFDQLEQRAGFAVERNVLAAAVLRLQLSLVIVPPDAEWNGAPDVIVNLLNGLLDGARMTRAASGRRP